ATLQYHSLAFHDLRHRRARIVVAVLLVAAPDQPRGDIRFIRVDEKRAYPAFIALVVRDQNHSIALTPYHGSETLLRFEKLDGLGCERRLQHHDAVAMRNFLLRIAVVERAHPDECRGLIGPPTHAPWSSNHAVNRDLIGERQTRDFVNKLAL